MKDLIRTQTYLVYRSFVVYMYANESEITWAKGQIMAAVIETGRMPAAIAEIVA